MVFEFESEYRDEILEILGVIDYIDKDKFILEEYCSGYPINRRYSQLDYLKKAIKAYQGRDADTVKYVESVRALIDKPLDQVVLEEVRTIRKKVKFPRKLDISVFYQLTGRLPHEELEFKEEDFIIRLLRYFRGSEHKVIRKNG